MNNGIPPLKKSAFTLAETLITLSVIGIVAVLAILGVQGSIMDNVRTKHTIVAKHKFAKAMEQMGLNNNIGPYYGSSSDATKQFVDTFNNYYKTVRTCDNEHLDECFGYKEFKFQNGSTYDITKATSGKVFQGEGGALGDDYDSDTVGIIGLDGTRFIVSFNKNCKEVPSKVYEWTDETNHEAMVCVAAVMDIDGNKAPNTVGKDVSFLGNAYSIGKNCVFEVDDICAGAFIPLTPVSYSECMANKSAWGLQYCQGEGKTTSQQASSYDSYAAAAKACGTKANMLNSTEICKVMASSYSRSLSYTSSNGGGCSGYYNSGTLASLGLSESSSDAYVWANYDESMNASSNAIGKYIIFDNSRIGNGTKTRNNYSMTAFAICRM